VAQQSLRAGNTKHHERTVEEEFLGSQLVDYRLQVVPLDFSEVVLRWSHLLLFNGLKQR
jgi:hypothetical protein